MIDQRVGAVLVTGPSGELVGILTERDFLDEGGRPDSGYEELPVAGFMTRSPETVGPHRHPGRGAGEDGCGRLPAFAGGFRRQASWGDFGPRRTSSLTADYPDG